MSTITQQPIISVVSKLFRWSVGINDHIIETTWTYRNEAFRWIHEHYPDHVKVAVVTKDYLSGDWKIATQFRHKDELVEIDEGGSKSIHPTGGVLFKLVQKTNDTNGILHVRYQRMDDDKAYLEEIYQGIQGHESADFKYSLVRRNSASGWHYYPVPLIFTSRHQRVVTATNRGVRIPIERWVRRRKKDILQLLLDHNIIDGETMDMYSSQR